MMAVTATRFISNCRKTLRATILLSYFSFVVAGNQNFPFRDSSFEVKENVHPEDSISLSLEEEPDDSLKAFNITVMYDVCIPTQSHGSNNENNFDDARFTSWLREPYKKASKLDDDDFLDCAILRFQEGIHDVVNDSDNGDDNDQSIRRRKVSTRPKAILHVGPRKTGSTAIQEAMIEKYSINARSENYLFLAEQHHLFTHCLCLDDIPEIWMKDCDEKRQILDDMQNAIGDALQEKRNVLISSESFDQVRHVDVSKIKKIFDGFDVHIVVTYRRYFEWMVSKFGQDYRHSHDWDRWQTMKPKNKNIVSSFSADTLKETYAKYSPLEIYKMYKQGGFTTHMLNFHVNDDIVKSFFCLELLNTPDICKLASQGGTVRANKAETTSYDEVAVAVMEAGLLDGKNLTRPQARKFIQAYFEDELGLSEVDLPKNYIQQRELDLLERISIMSESLAVPDFYEQMGYQDTETRFESYKTTKFLSVDTQQVLLEHGTSIQSFISLRDISSRL